MCHTQFGSDGEIFVAHNLGVLERHVSHTTWESWRNMCHTQLRSDGETCDRHNLGGMERHMTHTT